MAGDLQFLHAARQRWIIEIATECAVSVPDPERRVVRWSTGTQRPKGNKGAKCRESTFRSFFRRASRSPSAGRRAAQVCPLTRELTRQKALEDAMATLALDLDERVIESGKQVKPLSLL